MPVHVPRCAAPARCCEAEKPPASSSPFEGGPSSAGPASTTDEGGQSNARVPRKMSENWSGAGIFADDEPLPLSFWLFGRSPRRAILPTIAIWGVIAPAVNLWGSGSFLASLFPGAARDTRLDTFYPVGERGYPYTKGFLQLDYNVGRGFKRYVDEAGRYEFRYPAEYVQDAAVFIRKADAAYSQRMMDPTLAATPSARPMSRRSTGPDVAFGPAGGTGEENLSVVIGSLTPGFTLRGTLGQPTEAASRLLAETIAKDGVRETTLLSAFERASARTGKPLYQFEYRVDYPNSRQPPTYTICVVGSSRGARGEETLFTFASRVPQAVWDAKADELREAANSFVLL